MKRTFCLIEVDRVCYVRGDRGGLVTRFSNSVYLDGERHRNAHLVQLAGECDCLRSTPTVPVDNDCGSLFLERRQNAIVVGIEEADNLMKGLSPMMVPIHFCVDGRVTVAKICGKLHFRVLGVIPADKASDKPNNDHVPDAGVSYRRTHLPNRHFLAVRDTRCQKNHCGQNNESGELPMPTVLQCGFSRSTLAC